MRRRAGLIVVAAIVAIVAAACLPVKPAADRGAPADRPAVAGPPAGAPTGSQNGPLGSCSVFPPDNPWNTDVSNYPVSANSANYIANILSSGNQYLHPDFGGGGAYGIPYVTVGAGEPPRSRSTSPRTATRATPVRTRSRSARRSRAAREPNGDRHVIAVDRDACKLYELYRGFAQSDHWDADAGAVFDLRSNALRPLGWTSADAAGLPIFPGLARYDEVANGQITTRCASRSRAPRSGYILPATHYAASSSTGSQPAADGAAPAAQGELRHLALHAARRASSSSR